MQSVVVVGSQWGDEGKGKIVDWLSERADVIVRFQGGHNAGHTLVINGVTYKLSLLPSGVVRGGKVSLIGNGVVIDPWALMAEIDKVREQGVTISPDTLKIAENACLILPIHQKLDAAAEALRGAGKIGTTGRGIGPAYEDKVGRRALRVCSLTNIAATEQILQAMLAHHNPILVASGAQPMTVEEILTPLREIAPKLLAYSTPVWRLLEQYRKEKKRILFEGAQGVMLDVDSGTYPYVTSSNTLAGQATIGTGSGINSIGYVLGITKAYTTRVGSGPFPSELHDEIGTQIGERGHEFGTVTGRKRRCGWFDAVLVRQAVVTSGIDGIALTKLDVLDELDELSICTGYTIDGKPYDYLPSCGNLQSKARPIYETMPGWKSSTRGSRNWKELPKAAVDYIRRIEALIGCPVAMLSTSPAREDTILIEDPFGATRKAA